MTAVAIRSVTCRPRYLRLARFDHLSPPTGSRHSARCSKSGPNWERAGGCSNTSTASTSPPADSDEANQALGAEYIARNAANLPADVYDVPKELDQQVALLKLGAMGLAMDTLSDEQAAYLVSWESGT